jgi:alpha-aminoadipic semialdehyde synthase
VISDKSERDLVVLRHEVGIVWPDGRREIRGINLVSYGDAEGYSAMSKTVGYPAAIAAKMVLDGELFSINFLKFQVLKSRHFAGEIQTRGNVLPFSSDIYLPMLSRLKLEGIQATEQSFWL